MKIEEEPRLPLVPSGSMSGREATDLLRSDHRIMVQTYVGDESFKSRRIYSTVTPEGALQWRDDWAATWTVSGRPEMLSERRRYTIYQPTDKPEATPMNEREAIDFCIVSPGDRRVMVCVPGRPLAGWLRRASTAVWQRWDGADWVTVTRRLVGHAMFVTGTTSEPPAAHRPSLNIPDECFAPLVSKPAPKTSADLLAILATTPEWESVSGKQYRHNPDTGSVEAFQCRPRGGRDWADTYSPGGRPWSVRTPTPAPATLREVVEFASVHETVVYYARYRRASSRAARGVSQDCLKLSADDALASDWLYSLDGGITWKSPGAAVETLTKIE